jgi:RHS repeat-associated protein
MLIADSVGTTVWRWDQQEPFGVNVPDENPSGVGAFEFPMRFPGQYFDKESNLAYNYFRDYNSAIGRYAQSDRIGLRGGLNTYSYVSGNPIAKKDPLGLQEEPDCDWATGRCHDSPDYADPRQPNSCFAECLGRKGGTALIATFVTAAAAYAFVTLVAPEITVPATIIVVAVLQQGRQYYYVYKVTSAVIDCQCECNRSSFYYSSGFPHTCMVFRQQRYAKATNSSALACFSR